MNDRLKANSVNAKGFGIVPKLVMQDQNLSIGAKGIYAYFCSFAGAGDICFPTRKKMCLDLGVSNDTLGKYIKELSENGYVSIEQIKKNGKFSHNTYTICTDLPYPNLPCPKISDTENFVYGKLDTNNNIDKNNSYYKNNSNKRKKEVNLDSIITEYTNNQETKDLLIEWMKIRTLKHAPLTDRALKMNLKKMEDMAAASGMSVNAYLSEIITRGWAAFYEIKSYGVGNTQNRKVPTAEDYRGSVF